MTPSREKRPCLVVSSVEDDGTLIEAVYRPERGDTALVVARGNDIQIVPTWKQGETVCAPPRPTNNLLKHEAILLPSEPTEYGTTEELLSAIRHHVARYLAQSEEAAGLSAAYVLLSWVYDAFNELPYLRFRGDYGTGKTRALFVLGSICCKPFFASGASTISPIFHTLDTFKGTLIFDEADFRFTDEKAELVKIFNNGNAKGFPVLRTQVTAAREFDPRAFAIFGPKIVGMRKSYDDRALESRFLTIEMEPGQVGNAPLNLPEEQKQEALLLRNQLLMYRLRNRLSIKLDPALADPQLEPRMNQILLPILSVLPSDKERRPVRAAATAVQTAIVTDRERSSEGQVLATLFQLLAEHPSETISLADVTRHFAATHGHDYERPITNRWVGSMLRRLGIVLYKTNGTFAVWPDQHERFIALRARYGIDTAAQNVDAG